MKDARPGKALTIGGVTIVPLERERRYQEDGRDGFWAVFVKEAVGIIIQGPDGRRVLDLNGEEVPPENFPNP